MDLILSLFTKRELLIIGLVIGSLLFIVIILTIWDKVSSKRKEAKEVEEAFDDLEKIETNNTLENIEISKPINENIEIKNEPENIEVLDITTPKENIQEIVQEEVLPNEEMVISIEEEKLEEKREQAKLELLEVEESLKNPKSLEDTLYNLETYEEENAIISYQELLETTKELKIVETDSGDEVISIKELFSTYEETPEPQEEIKEIPIENAYKGDFTSTPIISPIVGIENDVTSLAEIQLENTANLEKLDKEIRKTNEFLTILNDLKKNLD